MHHGGFLRQFFKFQFVGLFAAEGGFGPLA
jgi:hypothetical protein